MNTPLYQIRPESIRLSNQLDSEIDGQGRPWLFVLVIAAIAGVVLWVLT